ncbi:hypothetical protein HWV62_20206 [Athelia sp. TMB]|nr:hypothetical protein HWV62_20206 [Athelia sp. TMB]
MFQDIQPTTAATAVYPFDAPLPSEHQNFTGSTCHFATGQFEGQCIRAELIEIQQAEMGRKYAKVDRRALDPPPIVHLKLYSVIHAGTIHEYLKELNYDDVESLGLICHVDLFSAPTSARPTSQTVDQQLIQPPTQENLSIWASQIANYVGNQDSSVYLGYQRQSGNEDLFFSGDTALDVARRVNERLVAPSRNPQGPIDALKRTQALVGALFVQPVIVNLNGKHSLVFAFPVGGIARYLPHNLADLSVRLEGDFILRYRVFDMFSKPEGMDDVPILAECYGGRFRVYESRDFPGLPPSTDLTKELARWGVRLNVRETQRKVKKDSSSDNSCLTSAKRGL